MFRTFFQKVTHSLYITEIEPKIALVLEQTPQGRYFEFKIKPTGLISLTNNLSTVLEKLGMPKSIKSTL